MGRLLDRKSKIRIFSFIYLAFFLAFTYNCANAKTLLKGDLLGDTQSRITSYADTLLDIARLNELGFVEIVAANQGIDPWIPGEGTKIILPTGHLLPNTVRTGIVINLAEHRLYHFTHGKAVISYPIGVGRQGWDTPLGITSITRKKQNPIWFPPQSIRAEKPELPIAVGPGPYNPLGKYAIYLDWPSYLLHGTNMPWGVGRRVSHGCIRLYPEGIQKLFSAIEIETRVEIINQPIKVGISNGKIYIEAHPEPHQADELERSGYVVSPATQSIADTLYKIRTYADSASIDLNWEIIRETIKKRTGIPVNIGSNSTNHQK